MKFTYTVIVLVATAAVTNAAVARQVPAKIMMEEKFGGMKPHAVPVRKVVNMPFRGASGELDSVNEADVHDLEAAGPVTTMLPHVPARKVVKTSKTASEDAMQTNDVMQAKNAMRAKDAMRAKYDMRAKDGTQDKDGKQSKGGEQAKDGMRAKDGTQDKDGKQSKGGEQAKDGMQDKDAKRKKGHKQDKDGRQGRDSMKFKDIMEAKDANQVKQVKPVKEDGRKARGFRHVMDSAKDYWKSDNEKY